MIKKVAVVLCISGVLFITFGSHNVNGESTLAKAIKQPIQTETLIVSEDKSVESNYICPNGTENCHDDAYHQVNCVNTSNSWNCPNGQQSCINSEYHQSNCNAWNCPNGTTKCNNDSYHQANCVNTTNSWSCPNGQQSCINSEYHNSTCADNTWHCPNGEPACDSSTTHRNHRSSHGNQGHHGGRHH